MRLLVSKPRIFAPGCGSNRDSLKRFAREIYMAATKLEGGLSTFHKSQELHAVCPR